MDSMISGFSIALAPVNLLFCFIGCVLGTLVGVLPGMGSATTIALLMPITFHLSPVTAIIMLAGIFYGAQYGGSTTSILVNIPGEATSVVTCIDGYQMARQGRAGPALGISAFASFIAGTLGVMALAFFGPPLAELAIKFGPPEFASLVFLSLMLVGYLGGKSLPKALAMAAIGLTIGTVGQDPVNIQPRFVFGILEFNSGMNIVPILMGLFGISEILSNVERIIKPEVLDAKIKTFLPSLQDWRESIGPILRGAGIGFFIGLIPGSGAIVPTFISYGIEKKVSKHPEQFGRGAIEGVAGPESANNAAAQGTLVPLLTFGIPPNVTGALLLAALMIHGVRVGPLLITQHPDVFWGCVASMYLGNVMLLILNLPLIPLWVRVLKVPYYLLFPLITLLCLVGSYSINNSLLDLVVLIVFGVAGYLMQKYEYPPAPLVLGLILSPILEKSFRQALIISRGDFSIFFTRPISAAFLIVAIGLLLSHFFPLFIRRFRANVAD